MFKFHLWSLKSPFLRAAVSVGWTGFHGTNPSKELVSGLLRFFVRRTANFLMFLILQILAFRYLHLEWTLPRVLGSFGGYLYPRDLSTGYSGTLACICTSRGLSTGCLDTTPFKYAFSAVPTVGFLIHPFICGARFRKFTQNSIRNWVDIFTSLYSGYNLHF